MGAYTRPSQKQELQFLTMEVVEDALSILEEACEQAEVQLVEGIGWSKTKARKEVKKLAAQISKYGY